MAFTALSYTPKEILKQLAHSKNDHLPPYYFQAMDEMRQASRDLSEKMVNIIKVQGQSSQEQKDRQAIQLSILISEVARLKRYMLLYTGKRLDKIEYNFWQNGNDINPSDKQNLSKDQSQYLVQYRSLVNNYSLETGLTVQTAIKPFRSIDVEVRVKENCGDIITEKGELVRLSKGSTLRIRRREVEHLILQGYLQEM